MLEWLHDPNARAEGRTLTLAVAAIRVACRNPRTPITLFDHSSTAEGRRQAFLLVRDLVGADYRLGPFADFSMESLTLNLPQAIWDWAPPEGFPAMASARELGRAAGARLAHMWDVEVLPEEPTRSMGELLALNQETSRQMATLRIPTEMLNGTPTRVTEDMRAAQQAESVRDDFEAFHGGMATPFSEAETISQEAADRFAAELNTARAAFQALPPPVLEVKDMKAPKKKPAPKPEPKSVWDRLLADD